MKTLKIAASDSVLSCFDTEREITNVHTTDFSDIAAIVVSVQDIHDGILAKIHATGLSIPTLQRCAVKKSCLLRCCHS